MTDQKEHGETGKDKERQEEAREDKDSQGETRKNETRGTEGMIKGKADTKRGS